MSHKLIIVCYVIISNVVLLVYKNYIKMQFAEVNLAHQPKQWHQIVAACKT